MSNNKTKGGKNNEFHIPQSVIESEYEKQRDFYKRIGINPDLSHNTDGIYKGNLFEHKITISNIYKVLFQAIKYASRIRIRGERLPANIILTDLMGETAYLFKSQDLLQDIEKVYFGAASKDNDEYSTNVQGITIHYSDSTGLQKLLEFINCEEYVRYHIDKTNVVGLAQQFYKSSPNKDWFIKGDDAEIRKPTVLADRIYPYEGKDNLEFEDIMDCLNPGLLQREQGAFYTPVPYVRKMHEMLFDAIAEIPENMDYIIIDRCAGTGNLQEGLPDEILKHCILSTIEYNEYAILNYKYGDKCLVVIPNTDALNFDIIPAECNMMNEVVNDYVREKVEDENCAIILMENPPFSEAGSGGTQNTGKKENLWKKSFVITQMKAEGKYKGAILNDLSNLFIWSGFKYYLRKPHDSYILYSPTKYWRNQQLVNKKFCGGFLCDRRGFHASQASAVGCIWWKNIDDYTTERLCLPPYDIVGDNIIQTANDVILQKAYHNLSEAYDNRAFPDDEDTGILCEANGLEFDDNGRKKRVRPIWNKNIIAYLKADSFAIDRKHVILTTAGYFKGDGFYLRSDNFIEKLPLFVASVFPYDKWYKTDVYSKSYDGQGIHLQDKNFLKQCLIYTALTPKNKCRSLLGSDGRFYRNELCFHKKDTLAWTYLQKFVSDGYTLTDKEKKLLKCWDEVLRHTEETEEYADIIKNENARIGLWQIMEEINIKVNTGKIDRKGSPILRYKYIMLNTAIKVLDNSIKEYYNSVITPLLFRYQLIK